MEKIIRELIGIIRNELGIVDANPTPGNFKKMIKKIQDISEMKSFLESRLDDIKEGRKKAALRLNDEIKEMEDIDIDDILKGE